jgi:hypothetical protein
MGIYRQTQLLLSSNWYLFQAPCFGQLLLHEEEPEDGHYKLAETCSLK